MRHWILALLVSILLFPAGCTSYVVFPKEIRGVAAPENPPEAYIINPELEREYAILETSGLFDISDSRAADISILLEPMETEIYPCGNPVMFSAMLLGIIPAYLPDRYHYTFVEERPDTTVRRRFELKVAARFSIWELFIPDPGKDRRLAEALRGEYLTDKNSGTQ